jgi:GT2 family glycosyltransferase
VLLDTIRQLLALSVSAKEIIVVDQSETLDPQSHAALHEHDQRGEIRWIRRKQRNIPAAMNHGVRIASGAVILFLDDDVRIECELIQAHYRSYSQPSTRLPRADSVVMVAGQVIQPWQQPLGDDEPAYPGGMASEPDAFRFNSAHAQRVYRFMAGNVSIRRDSIVEMGGFDENFVGAAYRFEADFAQRLCDRGSVIYFDPSAQIHHLKAEQGGTRAFGHHLRTFAPWHSTGRYYYLMNFPRTPGLLRRTVIEVAHSIFSREHLRAPWRVVSGACAEISGLVLAVYLRLRGRRLPFREQD